MIKVHVVKKDDLISHIKVTGHAFMGEPGNDLICAGVSSIVIGTLNALNEICGLELDNAIINDGHVEFNLNDKLNDKKVQLIITHMIIQLKTIEESYGDYIKII